MSEQLPYRFKIKDKEIKQFIEYPHIFGHFLGYDLLSQIHSDWIKYCWMGTGNKALQAHRNSYKTTAILIVGTIWWLTFGNPEETILFLRKSWEQSAEIVTAVKNQFESEAVRYLYKSYFNIDDLRGKPFRDSALNLVTKEKVTPESNVSCLGVGGNITGSHPSKIFADDLITLKDRISRAEREHTKSFIKELVNISSFGGSICYTGTPWHKDDGWNLISKPQKYPIGSIKIKGMTKKKKIEFKKTLGTSLYSANYELKHIADEDQLFPEPKYGKWPERFKRVNAWCDPSYEGKATTALAMIGIDFENRAWIRGWVWWKHIIECYKVIVDNLNFYKCGNFYIETNADKGYSKRDLAEKWPATLGRDERANKHIKIIAFLKKNWEMLIFAEDCQPEFVNQIMDYSEDADLKDAADSAASLIREMRLGKKSILDRFG
jgi:hypothetical protein